MRYSLGGLLVAGSLIVTIEALAQSAAPSASPSPTSPFSTSPSSPSSSAPPDSSSTPVVQTVTAPAAPVNPSKRFACRAAAQKYMGQDRADQMQLCMAQAHLDCLKQAIDQKITGPQRKDFVKSCAG